MTKSNENNKRGWFRKKDKQDDINKNDLAVVDFKEPFSWAQWFDDYIRSPYKSVKRMLDEHGILFALRSPFQYRNRLLLKLLIIVICIIAGVVPQAARLINDTRTRNAQSEIAAIAERQYSADGITLVPLMSGMYENQHVLVFDIKGETSQGIPSTDDGFDVRFGPVRGVIDEQNVVYRTKIIPVSESSRLLVIYVDNRKQNDNTGVFGVNVGVKGGSPMRNVAEVTLSNTQAQTLLFDAEGIHLDVLSSKLVPGRSNAIATAEDDLNRALAVYQTNENRLKAIGVTIYPTSDELREWVNSNKQLANVMDDSTTQIVGDRVDTIPKVEPLKPTITLPNGKTVATNDSNALKDGAKSYASDGTSVQSRLSDVTGKLQSLNNVRLKYYQSLTEASRALNQTLSVDELGEDKVPEEFGSDVIIGNPQ